MRFEIVKDTQMVSLQTSDGSFGPLESAIMMCRRTPSCRLGCKLTLMLLIYIFVSK